MVHHLLALAASLFDLYDELDGERRREFLAAVFSSVVLSDKGVVGYTLTNDLARLLEGSATRAGTPQQTARRLIEAA